MKLWERFILEPRSPYSNHGSSSKCYLVAYDTVENHHVYADAKTGRYQKFNNSKEAFEWLSKVCSDCD